MWRTQRCGPRTRCRNGIPAFQEDEHVSPYPIDSKQGFGITHESPTAAVNEFGLNAILPPLPTSMICVAAWAPAANANTENNDRYIST